VKQIAIIAAVPGETALLAASLQGTASDTAFPFVLDTGRLGALSVAVCNGGIGKANAAAATTAVIERYRPDLVITTGCAGAYPGSGLAIGDLAAACEEVLGDEGAATPEGWLDLREMQIPSLVRGDRSYYNAVPLSRDHIGQARCLAERHGTPLFCGRFVTLSTCSGTLRRGEEMTRRFNALAENMEGAAVALTCLRYGIECLEVRGISNLVEDRDPKRWDIPRAAEAAQRFVLQYLEEMGP
jgi:futalosine hydrolase